MSTTTSERVASVLALLATGEVRAPIDHTVDLAGVVGALRAMEEGTLRGKVVVLNFIYTNCPDVCPLHSEKIAEIQRMMSLSSLL